MGFRKPKVPSIDEKMEKVYEELKKNVDGAILTCDTFDNRRTRILELIEGIPSEKVTISGNGVLIQTEDCYDGIYCKAERLGFRIVPQAGYSGFGYHDPSKVLFTW